MSTIFNSSPVSAGFPAVKLPGSSAERFSPVPRNGLDFAATAGKMVSATANVATATLGGVLGMGGMTDIPGLLNKQMEIQMIMQLVSMESNISRSKHETEMAPIRNMRVG
jgi:hypothetical protein